MKKNYLYLLTLLSTFLLYQNLSAQTAEYKTIIDNYLEKNSGKSTVSGVEWEIVSYSTSIDGLVQVFGQQIYQGLPVFKAVSSYTLKNKEVVYEMENYVQTTSTKQISTTDRGVIAAINSAANHLNLGSAKKLEILDQVENKSYKFGPSGISLDPITAKKVFFASDYSSLKLAYTINIHTPDGKHWWSALIDATTGNLLKLNDHLLTCNFGNHGAHTPRKTNFRNLSFNTSKSSNSTLLAGERYLVFPLPLESPGEGNQQVVTDPQNLIASPFGWHDDNGTEGAEYTITRGNNAYAFLLEPDFSIGDSPDGGADLNFNFPFDANSQPQEYTDASLTNLFYVNNKVHDILYFYGFDEAGGNFQTNNYGKGRSEVIKGNTVVIGDGDPVFASGQDINGFNNATFGTDPDGEIAIMQMFLWSAVGEAGEPLTIYDPENLAGKYTAYPASFGPSLPAQELRRILVLGTDTNEGSDSTDELDGCDPLTNPTDLEGKIAVFRRGSCNFTEKVILAQNAGALAVIIVNNNEDPIFQMGGSDPEITIPSIMVSKADGDRIIGSIESGNTVDGGLIDAGPYRRDGSLDNVIIVHEYGHGVSMRLTGGPDTVDCLETCTRRDADGNCVGGTFTEQMGEGWSDYLGLLLTMQSTDTPQQSRPIGNYVVQGENDETLGIRPFPYSTDLSINPVTYGDTNNTTQFSAPHGVGSVWASMLWDITWDLIDIYGFTSDIYLSEGGNTISLKLVMQAMKMQPCQPGFVDGRDAILAADEVLYGGKHACLIWKAFARRGLGINASQGEATSRLDQTENFDVPEEFQGNCNLSLGEIDDTSKPFFLFPNPSRNQVNVFINGNFGEGNITVFDLNGRKVLTQKQVLSDQIEINTSSLSQGVYILQIKK